MSRRGSGPPPVALAALLVVIIIGVVLVINLISGSSDNGGGDKTTAVLVAAVEKVPVPEGATLAHAVTRRARGDASANVERQYTLTSASGSSNAVRDALQGGDCKLVDLQSGAVAAIDAATFDQKVTPTSGDVYVLPPGVSGGGIEVSWKDDRLYLMVKGGDVS